MEVKNEQKIEALEGKHFDIGLTGVWYGANYGSVMTYYALYRTLTELGYSVLMIDKLHVMDNDWEMYPKIHSRVFAAKHYAAISPSLKAHEMKLLNQYCDAFLMGCDQVWNYAIAKNFGLNNYFDYVADDKKKLSYASSFGHDVSFTPKEMISTVTRLFQRFDAISVREADAVQVLKNEFGVEGTQVVDPVFLLEQEEYDEIIADSKAQESEKYVLSYILDPTPEIREALLFVAKKKNLKLINMLDGYGYRSFEKNKQKLNLPNIVENLDAPTWLWYLKNAEFVITDSCHGASFSLVFERPFVAIANKERGVSRFESLVDVFDIRDRYIYDVKRLQREPELLEEIDYSRIRKIFDMEKKRSLEWLKNALQKEKSPQKTVEQSVPKKECCGCGACFNACPADAIRMEYDKEGIQYPIISAEKCIRCGKCTKVCPALHPYEKNEKKPECYAAYGDDKIREVSSSGGIFSLAAEWILAENGAVCGAAFDNQFELSQKVIYDVADLPDLQRSKYIQSNTKNTYQEIKKVLEEGRPALYVGCPCQIAGLRGFLGKEYERLFTIDLMCHGGPSPVAFQRYLKEVHGKKPVSYVGFRDKGYFKWEINSTGMTVKYRDGSVYRKRKLDDLYYRAFTSGLMTRPHCPACNYAKLPRLGDITRGDFWGVAQYDPKLTDGKGTSIVAVNSDKGKELLDRIKEKLLLLEEIDINHILTHGQPFAKPCNNNPRRYRFLRMLENCSFEKSLECCETNKFDFTIVGMNDDSYGEILAFYALYLTVARKDYSVLMVKRPKELSESITPLKYRLTNFADRYYPIVSNHDRLKRLKKLSDTSKVYILDEKEVYTGHWNPEEPVIDYKNEIADAVMDKVFLIEKGDYELLLANADCDMRVPYLACDSRGMSKDVLNRIQEYAKKESLTLVELSEDMAVENWLYYIRNSQAVAAVQKDVINFAVIFQKVLIIPEKDVKKELQKYLVDLSLSDRLWKETASLQETVKRVGNLNYKAIDAKIRQNCANVHKRLEKRLRREHRSVIRKENPLWKRCARKGISAAKRVMPDSMKKKVKKILGK